MEIKSFNPRRANIAFAAKCAILHAKAKRCVVRFENEGIDVLVTENSNVGDVVREHRWAHAMKNPSIGPVYSWTEEKAEQLRSYYEEVTADFTRISNLRRKAPWMLAQFKKLHEYFRETEEIDEDDIKELRDFVKTVVQYASGDLIE